MNDVDSRCRVAFTGSTVAEFFYEYIRGVLDYAEQSDRWQLVGHPTQLLIPFDEIDLSAVDGVIGFFHQRHWASAVKQAGVPAVNMSNRHADLDLPRVASDDEAVGRLGGRHLLERGFVHFGFAGPFFTGYAQRRWAGFRSVIEQDAGRTCHMLSFKADQPDLREVIGQWIEPLPKPIGVMTASDLEGRLLIDHVVAMGLEVPGDVAVLGVDNRRWLTQLARVAMSSVELDQRQIGYRAARLLDGLMQGQPPPPPQWVGPLSVITRQSSDIVVTEDPIVAKALAFIRDHRSKPIGVEDVLDRLDVSRKTLELHLKRAMGLTPQVAILRAKIDQARQLLVESNQPVYQIAESCGFDGQPRFFRAFKRQTGMTPGEYRRRFGARPD
jgi:LacI family transcriptional regulator